ncbi:MAG: glycerophosphodiester phosphodiesterase family protein [Anaerolineae bacterium]|nr:glycerophosphodiester phosphodiesterase family protein [Anaerolineae bacterium]
MKRWGDRGLNIAHRGASLVAPPNTLAAFKMAAQLGADGIECDVHLSADGVPVVIHDFTVDATTDGSGRVCEMTVAELKRLDAGTSFSPAFAGERIPALEEVLEAVGESLLINIELKTTTLRDNGLERAVVSLLESYGPARQGRVLLSSFNPLSLRRVKRLSPHLPVGLLYAPDLPLPLRRAWLAPLVPHEARHPQHSMVTASYMSWARRHRYWVHTWTVNDADEMRRLLALGVEAIMTDVPDLLHTLLREHGLA